ncbi:hypothetical protein PZ938_01260 [Luteipulveratus sp. YIM 133132]|uniref:hypothetical protein n=1 Tax=Luteipulveratus flavus TaxID=3031728 RepID=UPI0023B115DE|nr:hypothetical protein [Luteipulveratus sp. YIM 133132]MDE9364223.1 hypothetical protein [Luteipulveratus sp. YIM 133132]
MGAMDWLKKINPWQTYRNTEGWPDITPPIVPPAGRPTFDEDRAGDGEKRPDGGDVHD